MYRLVSKQRTIEIVNPNYHKFVKIIDLFEIHSFDKKIINIYIYKRLI